MRTRLFIFDSAGIPLIGFDGGATASHAVRFVADNLARLASIGTKDCTVVEFDPMGDVDDANDSIQSLHLHRPECRTLPNGQREIIDLHRWDAPEDGTTLRSPSRCARAFRVIHAAADIANPRKRLRGAHP